MNHHRLAFRRCYGRLRATLRQPGVKRHRLLGEYIRVGGLAGASACAIAWRTF